MITNLVAVLLITITTNVQTFCDVERLPQEQSNLFYVLNSWNTCNMIYDTNQWRKVTTVTSNQVIRVSEGDVLIQEIVKDSTIIKQTEIRHVKIVTYLDEPERDITPQKWFLRFADGTTICATNLITCATNSVTIFQWPSMCSVTNRRVR